MEGGCHRTNRRRAHGNEETGVSLETEAIRSSIEEDSSLSISSSNFPSTPTSPPQFPIQERINRDHSAWSCSTLNLRASQETDPHPSDSSYYYSGRSDTSGDIYRGNNSDNMEAVDANNVPPDEVADIHPVNLNHSINHTTAEEPAAYSPSTMSCDDAVNDPYAVNFDHDASATTFTGNHHQRFVARRSTRRGTRRGHAGASSRGPNIPLGRGGTLPQAKRTHAQYDDDNDDNDDEDIGWTPKEITKQQKGMAPEPEVQRKEVHRRHISLRDRLIKGVTEPQEVGMRAYQLRKAEEAAAAAAAAKASRAQIARNPPREFLVPIASSQGFNVPPFSQPAATISNATNNATTTNSNNNNNYHDTNAPSHQPNPHIAYKSTPIHQLHFPQGLLVALKQNKIRWEGTPHSEGLVFIVARLVDGDVADMRAFSALQDATADALYMMVNEHPEAFARPRAADALGNELKAPRTERATSVIREITAPPVFAQAPIVPAPRAPVGQDGGGAQAQYLGNQYYYHPGSSQHGDSQHGGFRNDGTNREDTIDHDFDLDFDFDFDAAAQSSFFAIKAEDPELPRPSRIADPAPYVNDRGEMLLGDAPEPTYVFWGRYRISSFGLKMEARRADGAAVKISVHRKNLRKPVHG